MMIRPTLLAAAGAAMSLAACASTPPQGGALSTAELAAGDTQQVYARATEEERNRVYCRREFQTGSNRPVRICMTLAQRQRIQQDSQEAAVQAGGRMTPAGQGPFNSSDPPRPGGS